MSVTITPTVGRKVYFFADAEQFEPHDATIIKVCAPHWQANPFTLVNLFVIDPEGEQSTVFNVPCSPTPVPYPHFRWMDYQLKQAESPRKANSQDVPQVDLGYVIKAANPCRGC